MLLKTLQELKVPFSRCCCSVQDNDMFKVYKLSAHPSTWALIGMGATDVDWNYTGTVVWVIAVFLWVENMTPNTNRMQDTIGTGANVNECWTLHLLVSKDHRKKNGGCRDARVCCINSCIASPCTARAAAG